MRKQVWLLSGLLLGGPAFGAESASRQAVRLRSGLLDATAAAQAGVVPDPRLRVVAFDGPPTANQRTALAAAVDKVYTYLPDHAFLVRDRADSALAELPGTWSMALPAAAKIAPEIAAAGGNDPRQRMVMLHLVPDADLGDVAREVESLVGRTVAGQAARERFHRIRLLLTDAEIASLRDRFAALAAVVWIERESRKVLLNDSSVWVGQSGLDGGQSTPVFDRGLRGEGQIVAVLDTGVDIDSCYFWDATNGFPATNLCNGGTSVDLDQRKVLAVDFLWGNDCDGGTVTSNEWDDQGHGSHVGGTVAGDSTPFGVHGLEDGMAPAAKLVVQDCGFQTNVCADCPGIGCPVVDLNPVFQQTYNQGARIHTNSWGDEEEDPNFGQYTSGSEDADQFMWDHKDFLLLFAAGNNGGTSGTVDSPSTAKSPLSVGSTLRGASADGISSFSSRGPTDDQRIKPDVTFPGSNIQSASNDNNTGTFNCTNNGSSGTSMATPGVAGLSALVRQYFADGYYPTGVATPANSLAPSAALVKATIVNAGVQMAGEGTIPNNTQGWGRVTLDETLFFEGDTRALLAVDDPVGFPDELVGSGLTYSVLVSSASEPLEVTLAWTDYPSIPAAAINLVNDLDLEVTGPGGTFRGNVFSGGVSTTGGVADRRNTVEQVLIAAPTPGLWTITVQAFTVPQGPQPFALVATGDIVSCGGAAATAAVANSLVVGLAGGDADGYLDNCEAAILTFDVLNTGSTAATGVEIVSVSSPSHPATVFATPTWSAPSIGTCSLVAGANVAITSALGLVEGDELLVAVEITNDTIAPATTTTVFAISPVESDVTTVASTTWDFESDLEGWVVQSGTFVRANSVGGASGTSWYLQSSAAVANQCDVIWSPEVELTATSTLEVWTHYDTEGGTPWYDRANVSIADASNSDLKLPSSGRAYNVPNGSANGTCGTSGEGGWAGTATSWASSAFSTAALGSAGYVGRPVRLDLRYGTDGGVHLGGFRFDRVTLTNHLERGPDAQVCGGDAIFLDGFESGSTSAWSTTVP